MFKFYEWAQKGQQKHKSNQLVLFISRNSNQLTKKFKQTQTHFTTIFSELQMTSRVCVKVFSWRMR